jgi:predicted dehydrogenase
VSFPEARCYSNPTELLANGVPDLAIIATPNRLHAEMAVTCLSKGSHVLCEKPMAPTTSECDQMIDAAETANRTLAVDHFRGFFPSTLLIKRVLDTDLLGSIKSFRCTWCHEYDWPGRSAFKFQRKESGGGVLMDHGTHVIDLLLWWLGAIAVVRYQDDAMGGVEANCCALLETAGRVQGTIHLSHDWSVLDDNRFIIDCEKGSIGYIQDVVDRVDYCLHTPHHTLKPWLDGMVARMKKGIQVLDCFTDHLRNVILTITRKGPYTASARRAREGIALIEECYKIRTLLDMPWMDQSELRRAKELANSHST